MKTPEAAGIQTQFEPPVLCTEPRQPDDHQPPQSSEWLPGVRLRHSVPPVQYI